jgi:hypothetical protein
MSIAGGVAPPAVSFPAQAGIQFQAANCAPGRNWIPASAGMTSLFFEGAERNLGTLGFLPHPKRAIASGDFRF